MPKINVDRTKTINAPIEKVYNSLKNMGEWPKWSPWLIMDPKATVDVNDQEDYYEWEGKRVGSGNMRVVNSAVNKYIDYDLTFLKPWKSSAKVKMELKPDGDQTVVTWHMDSSLPFFMFWMKNMMKAFIGNDYERGLNLLKDYIEDGEVHSNLSFEGVQAFDGGDYIGIRKETSIAEAPNEMEKDFNTLMEWAKDKPNCSIQKAFTQYHKWDFVKGKAAWTAGIPYSGDLTDLPSIFMKGKIPPSKIYTLKHTGPYEHLGNAWTTLYTMHRNKEFKLNKKLDPFETYGNSPKETKPNELITYINFGIKE